MSIVIRECLREDTKSVLELIQSAFAEQRGIIDPPSSAETQTLAGLLKDLEVASALIAEDFTGDSTEGFEPAKIVGCMILTPKDDSLYIGKLSVLPKRRKEGIAFKLMQYAEDFARQKGFKTLSLAVRLVLKEQQSYYKRLGFETVSLGTHEGYPEPTYMNMEKAL